MENDQVTILSWHRSQRTADRALKKAPQGSYIIHEPETSLTHERFLIARKGA